MGTACPQKAETLDPLPQAMANSDQQPATQRAFSYTEMMNSGQQRLSPKQIQAMEQQDTQKSKESDNPAAPKP